MKVGVLGATGMIGHHTARALVARGHELVVLHRASSDLRALSDLRFEPRVIEIGDPNTLAQQLAGLDGLIHCAAYYPTKPLPWQQEIETATRQMNAVLDAAKSARIPRIVYVGAAIAIAKRQDGQPATGDEIYASQPADRAPYVQVKWALDRLARERAAEGLPVVIAVPAMCFGEYDRGPTTGRLITDVANGKLNAFIRGERNVVHTGEAGRGVVLALESGRPGQRYVLTGTNTTMDELVPVIAAVAGVEAPTRVVPLWVARRVSQMQEARYQLFGGELPAVSSTAIAVISSGQFLDGSKAKRELGFENTVSLQSTIERSYQWFVGAGYIHTSFSAAASG